MFAVDYISTHIPQLISILFVLNILIAFTIIFLERKNPSATLAWIMILFLIPAVGIVLYMIFSQNLSRQKIFKLSRFEENVINESLREQIQDMKAGNYGFMTEAAKEWKELITLNQVYGGAYFTDENRLNIITDGKDMMDRLEQDILATKTAVNVEYFIIKNDNVGRRLMRVLKQKASEGVEVRLLIDAMGGRQFSSRSRYIRELEEAGGKVAFFFPPMFRWINLKLNYRNHRKLVVIDGNIGYIGGFNIGREYVGEKKKFGYWRDTHLRIEGAAVQDINARFIMDWRFAAKEKIAVPAAYYSDIIKGGKTGVQIVSSGPDEQKEQIKRSYMRMISSAAKNIYVQTPYFVPDASILESLKMAAQSGVDVRLMIPCMPDHMFVYWATYAYAGELIRSGAKVYIYDDGFLHAKTMVVDGQVASIGSANFDVRSFKLNFEANAFIFDEAEARRMEMIFKNDMARSHELTLELYNKRSILIKFKESISRLLSDLL